MSNLKQALIFLAILCPAAAHADSLGKWQAASIKSTDLATEGSAELLSTAAVIRNEQLEIITFWKFSGTIYRCFDHELQIGGGCETAR